MLCIEVFRPDEMELILKAKENKRRLKSLGKSNEKIEPDIEINNDNPYFTLNENFIETSPDE